jgi:EAL domain-containing protein (putative c-di-GMP-specific phosphodiesterase class I)
MLALASLTYVAVSDGLREQSRERLHQAAKSAGMLLLERLVGIRDFVQVAAAGSDPGRWDPATVPLPSEADELLRGATLVRADGRATALRGAPVAGLAPGAAAADARGAIDARADPGEFVAVAEEIGLIGALGGRILERACRQARAWQREHRRALHVAVNLSSRQLRERDLPARVARVLADTGLDPRLLVLELTESELMEDAARGREQLAALRRLGVRISLDDFGTGYSSLGYLKEFPIDQLKIDRRFLGGIGRPGADAAIVRAIVEIGHALGLVVIAEGVERDEQCAALQALGCDFVQGWLLSPALPAEEIEKHLRAGAPRSRSRRRARAPARRRPRRARGGPPPCPPRSASSPGCRCAARRRSRRRRRRPRARARRRRTRPTRSWAPPRR